MNGICIDPDTCLCENEIDYHIGYNETEWNICYPICDRDTDDMNGCYNGTCIGELFPFLFIRLYLQTFF